MYIYWPLLLAELLWGGLVLLLMLGRVKSLLWQLLDRLSGPGRRIILGLGLLTVYLLRLLLLLDRRHIFHDKGKSF